MRFLSIPLLILLIACPCVSAAKTYKLSMLPRYSPDEINRRITPLAKYLSQKTGHKIEGVVVSDFSQYEKRLKNGSIAIGYENPYIYTLVSGTHQAVAMAVKGRDKDKFRGIIISRKDSGVSALEHLPDKNISIVGFTSAGGYLSQKLFLKKAGIDAATQMNLIEAVDNKQENVILSVYTGDTDAGFIRESALHKADGYIAISQIATISECSWLPNWAFSVKSALPEDLKTAIQDALLLMETDHPVLKALKIDSFKFAEDADYDPVREAAGLNE